MPVWKRGAVTVKKPVRQIAMHQRLEQLDKRCGGIIAEFEEISRQERRGENGLLFMATLARMRSALARIEVKNSL
jgi:hypothetical protein